jgi:hypothetical protein
VTSYLKTKKGRFNVEMVICCITDIGFNRV